MNREEKIEKLKAVLRGEITAEKAFTPFTTKIWIEVERGLFEEKDGIQSFAQNEIKPVANGMNILICMFHPDGEPVPELASSEGEIDSQMTRYRATS